jgi:hypothetical protein
MLQIGGRNLFLAANQVTSLAEKHASIVTGLFAKTSAPDTLYKTTSIDHYTRKVIGVECRGITAL